jgi:hypothetical protein
MRTDTTDGWDAGVDVLYPSSGPGQACLASDDLALSCSADYRALAATGEFLLVISAGDTEPVNVTWDASALPDGKHLSIYQVTLGDVGQDRADAPQELVGNTARNMAVTTSLEIPAGETRSYVIRYGDDLVFDLAFERGWNLVSLPIEPNDPALDTVLSDGSRGTICTGSVCTWTGQEYVDVAELHACVAYWVYVAEAQMILVEGLPVEQTSLVLARGWNQCGVTVECDVPLDGRIIGLPWIWSPALLRYEPVDVLRPGIGFWINVSEDDTEIPLNAR